MTIPRTRTGLGTVNASEQRKIRSVSQTFHHSLTMPFSIH